MEKGHWNGRSLTSAMHSKQLQTVTVMLAIVAFCTMLLSFLVYQKTAEALKQEITNAYQISLLHTRDRVQTYLRQLDQVTLQFEKIPEVQTFISPPENGGLPHLDAMYMVAVMQRIHASLDYVDNVVVYDDRSRALYASNSAMNPVYDNYMPVIRRFAENRDRRAFLNFDINGIPTAVYVRNMPAFGQVQPVYIVFHINQRIFDEFLGEGRYSDTGTYFMIDNNGRLFAHRGPADTAAQEEWTAKINQEKTGLPETGIGSNTLSGTFVTYLPMSFDGWVYGFAIPIEVFLHRLTTIRNVILIVAAALLAVSVVLSFLSSRWLWRGWTRIRTILDDLPGQGQGGKSNEFELLLAKFETVMEQSQKLRMQMNEMMPTAQETVMLSLLENGLRTAADWQRANRYGIPLKQGAFACFCVETDQDWEDGTYNDRDRLNFEYAVLSVIREVIGQDGCGFAVRVEKGMFAAAISDDSADGERLQLVMERMTDTIHRFIGEHFPLTVSIGMSQVRRNWSHLNLSYREAREILFNKLIAGGNQVFASGQFAAPANGDPFPIREVENDILYGIRTRNRDYAYDSIEQLRLIRKTPNVQYKWLQSRFVEMVQSLYRQIGKLLPEGEAPEAPTLDELLQLSTLDEWIEWLRRQCADLLIDRLDRLHDLQSEQAVLRIRAFVREHVETDLKLELCCKTLQIPVSFAKQALKEKLGCTFIDLVLEERINRAKEWLRSGGMSVEEIARKLQYSNAQNFSRTFKKAVGMPPGQYRTVPEYGQEAGG